MKKFKIEFIITEDKVALILGLLSGEVNKWVISEFDKPASSKEPFPAVLPPAPILLPPKPVTPGNTPIRRMQYAPRRRRHTRPLPFEERLSSKLILDALKEGPKKRSELADILVKHDYSESTTSPSLSVLMKNGFVTQSPEDFMFRLADPQPVKQEGENG